MSSYNKCILYRIKLSDTKSSPPGSIGDTFQEAGVTLLRSLQGERSGLKDHINNEIVKGSRKSAKIGITGGLAAIVGLAAAPITAVYGAKTFVVDQLLGNHKATTDHENIAFADIINTMTSQLTIPNYNQVAYLPWIKKNNDLDKVELFQGVYFKFKGNYFWYADTNFKPSSSAEVIRVVQAGHVDGKPLW